MRRCWPRRGPTMGASPSSISTLLLFFSGHFCCACMYVYVYTYTPFGAHRTTGCFKWTNATSPSAYFFAPAFLPPPPRYTPRLVHFSRWRRICVSDRKNKVTTRGFIHPCLHLSSFLPPKSNHIKGGKPLLQHAQQHFISRCCFLIFLSSFLLGLF